MGSSTFDRLPLQFRLVWWNLFIRRATICVRTRWAPRTLEAPASEISKWDKETNTLTNTTNQTEPSHAILSNIEHNSLLALIKSNYINLACSPEWKSIAPFHIASKYNQLTNYLFLGGKTDILLTHLFRFPCTANGFLNTIFPRYSLWS